MKKYFKNKKGFTLIEMLFYISIFVILSMVVINSLVTMTKAFKENTIQSDFVKSAGIMERMEREIKQANSVATCNSTTLRLNTTDEAGTAKTVQFALSGTNLVLSENDVTTGNLNLPHMLVSNLSCTQIITANGMAVRVSFNMSSSRDSVGRVYSFSNTGVLRGGY